MAKSYYTSIQLNGNSLLNGKIDARWGATPSGTTNPDGTGTATAGQISSYNGSLYVYSGTAWNLLSTSSGTVTSVTGTSPVVSSGGTTPAISLASGYGDTQNPYASKTANYVLAAPNGTAGVPTFRALVAADIPTPMTTLGDLTYGGASGVRTRLAGNTTTTKKFLRQTGDGTNSAAPAWDTLVSGDLPTTITGLTSVTSTTFVGSLTGNADTATSAGKWTTARNLAGNSVDGSANVAFANKFIVQGTTDAGLSGAQFLGSLGTGIVKNTTTTGVLSIAVAGDFPTLNQNTTGSAGSTTGTLTFGTGLTAGGASFNGSANVTITPVSATTAVAGIVQLSDSTSTTSSVLAATPTAVKSAYDLANAAVPKSGGTMTGFLTLSADPTSALHAATKQYVDGIATGINAHDAVKYATTAALGTTGNLVGGTITTTYNNNTTGVGATLTIASSSTWTSITIDGQSLTVGDRVLIKNQATDLQNGIYTVTSVGTLANSTSFVFTRATDSDQTPELGQGDLTYVLAGTANGGNGFVLTSTVTTVGTSSITWSQLLPLV
jgi:hypothetical protein